MHRIRISGSLSGFVVLLLLLVLCNATGVLLSFAAAQDISVPTAEIAETIETMDLVPVAEDVTGVAATPLSAVQQENMRLWRHQLRDEFAAGIDDNPPSPPGLPPVSGPEAQVAEAAGAQLEAVEPQLNGAPIDIVFGRNNRNPQANNPSRGHVLAEPAAVNNGLTVFSAGNLAHAEFSRDGGVSWTDASPQAAGPPEAPLPVGDNDIVLDSARRVAFWSGLNADKVPANLLTVRIRVRRILDRENDCAYDVIPQRGFFMDFPRLGLTKNFLWLTTNEFTGGFRQQRSRMYRFPIDPMANCAPVRVELFSRMPSNPADRRVWGPVQGATVGTTMYWGQLDNPTTFRIFAWPEAARVTSVIHRISPSTHTLPDCRGGVNNANFMESRGSWSIIGFTLRGALGRGRLAFFWNVGRDSAHPQGHIHGALFRETDFTLMAQPHIWNPQFCFGFPAVTANKDGDFGMSLALGGRAGGGGTAAEGAVSIADDLAFFDLFLVVAEGTHNLPGNMEGRSEWGDYVTIQPHEPCQGGFTATSYALLGGIEIPNVNSRYVEFGRRRSFPCRSQ
jgi:hypothetical protein